MISRLSAGTDFRLGLAAGCAGAVSVTRPNCWASSQPCLSLGAQCGVLILQRVQCRLACFRQLLRFEQASLQFGLLILELHKEGLLF